MEFKKCCFTGHRPEKLNMSEKEIKILLEKAIKTAVKDGYLIFISGMARGIDIWAGEIVLKLKNKTPDIQLICAPPYNGFEKRWEFSEQTLYHYLIEKSDYTEFVCKHYSKACFQMRNVYMVDNSERVIAAYNGSKGGTKNTIDYAMRKGVEVVNIFEQ